MDLYSVSKTKGLGFLADTDICITPLEIFWKSIKKVLIYTHEMSMLSSV